MKNVKEILIKVAKKMDDANHAAYIVLRDNGQKTSYPKDVNYRSVFGPYKVKSNTFETRTYYFNPNELHATSYGWWSMLKVIKGKLVRNACGYSMQTSMHQRMLNRALKALNIKADLTVHTKSNIGNIEQWRIREIAFIGECIDANNRSRKPKAKYGSYQLREFNKLVKAGIFKKMTNKELNTAIQAAKEAKDRKNQSLRERKARERAEQKPTLQLVVNQ